MASEENSTKQLALHTIQFMATRMLGTIVDTVVIWACCKYLFHRYFGQYIVAPTLGFEIATFVNFVTSYCWVWKSRVSEFGEKNQFGRMFVAFNLSGLVGFLIKMIFLLLFEHLLGFAAFVCNLLALGISGIFNFFVSDMVIFRKRYAEPENVILGIDELCTKSSLFNGTWGRAFARMLMDIFGVSRVNRLYDSVASWKGLEACARTIDHMGCNYYIGNLENLDTVPAEGAFITISNHPYGGLDGLILTELFGSRRSDYKIIVNNVLARAESLGDAFITVTPTTTEKKAPDAVTVSGIKQLMRQLGDGHGMGCFPSGAVSDYIVKQRRLQDREWQESMLRIIKKAKAPIIPVYFPDGNSNLYYFLGLVNWKIRLLRLPREFFNKHKGRHRVVIGEPISVEEQNRYSDLESYGKMLRSRVYDMPVPSEFVRRDDTFNRQSEQSV